MGQSATIAKQALLKSRDCLDLAPLSSVMCPTLVGARNTPDQVEACAPTPHARCVTPFVVRTSIKNHTRVAIKKAAKDLARVPVKS